MAFTAESVSILNGQDVVDVNSAESIENIKAGDFLQIGSFPLVEIKQAYKNGQGQKFIQLTKAWELTTQSNQPAIVIPTSGEFRAAVKALQDANILVNDNQQALQDYQNNLGTVTFKKSDGTTTTVKTLKQIEADNQAQMNAYHPYPWAMRKVEFEAIRAANEEEYAANGWVNKGKNAAAGANNAAVGDGLDSVITSMFANSLRLGRSVDAVGSSKTDYPVLHIAGVVTDVLQVSIINSDSAHSQIKLPPAEDGTRTYDSATGESVTHATPALAFASETATNKVVTDRVDMWGFEAFLRVINNADPFVYKNGLIQSSASNINGVTTVNDDVRPITYFAWYEGDTTSRGKGVNWQTATEAQRIAIASDPKNNIYFDDATGKFYQWCVRGRSFAGAGNGDWSLIDSVDKREANPSLRFDGKSFINPKGTKDTSSISTGWTTDTYFTEYSNNAAHKETGVFIARSLTDVAYNKECYFLVCNPVPRLNKGAYHPSFNDFGTKGFSNQDGTSKVTWAAKASIRTSPLNKADCFDYPTTSYPYSDGKVFGEIDSVSGSIAGGSTRSGRPDGRYFDAICASGQGGVCRDMRYSAHKLTAEDFAKEDLKIKSGEYRGREILLKTSIIEGQLTATGSSRNIYITDSNLGDLVTTGTKFYVVSSDGTVQSSRVGTVGVTGFISDDTLNNLETVTHVIVSRYEKLSISGEFTHTEVIGDPANILLCDDLKDGWVGSWNPVIPDGTEKIFTYQKPVTLNTVPKLFTSDGGASWTTGSPSFGFNAANNTFTDDLPANMVAVITYFTKARPTTPSTVSEIHGAISDVNYLFTSMDASDAKGRLLNFSLTGLIQTHAATATKIGLETIRLESLPLLPALGKFWGFNASAGELRHSPLSLDAPSNDSPAFKALNYNVAKNQQGFINYAYAQLTYDATAGDWGDDGKIHIADNQTTMPDENGHTNLVGTAQCVEPIGWV